MDFKLRVKEPGIISLYMHIYKYVCMCIYYLFIYDVLILCFICMYVHHMPSWSLWRSEEGIRSSITRIADGCEPPVRLGAGNG